MAQTERLPVVRGDVDGNIFAVMGAARDAMRKAGIASEKRDELSNRVTSSGSYNEALMIIGEYVEFSFEDENGEIECPWCNDVIDTSYEPADGGDYGECEDCGKPLCVFDYGDYGGYCPICA